VMGQRPFFLFARPPRRNAPRSCRRVRFPPALGNRRANSATTKAGRRGDRCGSPAAKILSRPASPAARKSNPSPHFLESAGFTSRIEASLPTIRAKIRTREYSSRSSKLSLPLLLLRGRLTKSFRAPGTGSGENQTRSSSPRQLLPPTRTPDQSSTGHGGSRLVSDAKTSGPRSTRHLQSVITQ